MLDNPRGQWGEVELPFVYADQNFSPNNPPRDNNGVLFKLYPSMKSYIDSGFGADSSVRAETHVIVKRGEHERETPPGYSGTGNVNVELLPGYRYWRFGSGGSKDEHTGRVSVNPDEAVQLVGTGAASHV